MVSDRVATSAYSLRAVDVTARRPLRALRLLMVSSQALIYVLDVIDNVSQYTNPFLGDWSKEP